MEAREGKGKVCALLDERRAMNDDAGQQGSRERARERERRATTLPYLVSLSFGREEKLRVTSGNPGSDTRCPSD